MITIEWSVFMEENIYDWLKNILESEYVFIKNLKRTEDVLINVLENKITHKRVVVKYLKGSLDVYKKLISISHPNLPVIYEVAQSEDKSILVEEYINGMTIGEFMEAERYTPKEVKKIILELCSALKLIHSQGIIHRDIKPENIIVNKFGNVKLIDFDISRINKENNSKDTVVLGTTGFAAPEQYGISETDARSDIYSIGILINVMLTGEHPSKKICDGKWQKIVKKCTMINPEDRYNTVDDLIKSIR